MSTFLSNKFKQNSKIAQEGGQFWKWKKKVQITPGLVDDKWSLGGKSFLLLSVGEVTLHDRRAIEVVMHFEACVYVWESES